MGTTWGPQGCRDHVGTMWRQHGMWGPRDVETMSGQHGNNMETTGMWRPHGDSRETTWDVGTTGMWRPCGDNMETTWGQCGDHRDVETTWGQDGDNMGTT